jgi:hypothetical protein
VESDTPYERIYGAIYMINSFADERKKYEHLDDER